MDQGPRNCCDRVSWWPHACAPRTRGRGLRALGGEHQAAGRVNQPARGLTSPPRAAPSPPPCSPWPPCCCPSPSRSLFDTHLHPTNTMLCYFRRDRSSTKQRTQPAAPGLGAPGAAARPSQPAPNHSSQPHSTLDGNARGPARTVPCRAATPPARRLDMWSGGDPQGGPRQGTQVLSGDGAGRRIRLPRVAESLCRNLASRPTAWPL